MIQLIDPCSEVELTLVRPSIFYDKNYFLRDAELRYDWTEEGLIMKNTELSCGSLVVEMFMDDGSEFDENIFKQEEGAFIVPYTEDTSFQGLYQFRFRAYYDDYPNRYFESEETFKVGIINPCESPSSLTAPDMLLNDLVFEYSMMTPSVDFTFVEFTPDPVWCDVQYSYHVNNKQGFSIVENWNEFDRTFTFAYP